jgi:hypothetical protein
VNLVRRRRPTTDFYAVAAHGRRVSDAELAVAEAALSGGGPVGERLVRQMRETASVWRRGTDDGTYELRISTTDDIRVRDVPSSGWTSPWISLIAMPSARQVELQLVVTEAGILEINGRTADGGRWPKKWSTRTDDLTTIRSQAPWLDLPTDAETDAARRAAVQTIEAWLGEPDARAWSSWHLSAHQPAIAAAIDTLSEAQRFRLPDAYRSLLESADGIEIGQLVIFGAADAYRLDMVGPARLVICPPDEDGVLTLAETGEVFRVAIDDPSSEGLVIAPDLRAWLMASLD